MIVDWSKVKNSPLIQVVDIINVNERTRVEETENNQQLEMERRNNNTSLYIYMDVLLSSWGKVRTAERINV